MPEHQEQTHTHSESSSLEIGESAGRTATPPPFSLEASPIQRTKDKVVSGKGMKRLGFAKEAIEHTKQAISVGAGNQISAVKASKLNSAYRTMLTRDKKNEYWQYTDKVKPIAQANPEAATAAKVELGGGGNCGEHAQYAFDYLRYKAQGETINRSKVKDFDHAFVLIGDTAKESDADIAVSDPWPTAPTAVLWEDHFAKPVMKKPSDLIHRHTMVADGKNIKDVIKAGLSLTDKGKAILNKSHTEKTTDDWIDKNKAKLWEHPNTFAKGKEFNYVEKKEEEKEN